MEVESPVQLLDTGPSLRLSTVSFRTAASDDSPGPATDRDPQMFAVRSDAIVCCVDFAPLRFYPLRMWRRTLM